MKRIGFSVEVPEWHFYGESRRWIHDFTDSDITEEAWNTGRVVAWIDAEGYYDGHDQMEPLPPGSWRKLPFQYFEHASDVPTGRFDIERLMVAFGIKLRPFANERPRGRFERIVHAMLTWWKRVRDDDTHMHDVLFLRLVVLTQFEKRPAKRHDFRVDVYDPDEQLP